MTDFERDLKRALQRREPPRNLAADVLQRIEAGRPLPSRESIFGRFGWRSLLAAAAALVMLAGALEQYQEYRKGQQAKQQLMLALEITSNKLAAAQAKVSELNRRRIGHDR